MSILILIIWEYEIHYLFNEDIIEGESKTEVFEDCKKKGKTELRLCNENFEVGGNW